MDDNLKKVWQTLSEDYELPDYDTFKEDMKDEENLRSLWTNAKKNYDLPDYDQFKVDMGFGDEDDGDDIATNGTLPANMLEEQQRKQGVLPAEDVKQYGTVSAAERRNPQMFQQPEPRKPMTEEEAFAAEVQSLNPETPQGYAVNEDRQRVKTRLDEQGNVTYDQPESKGYYQAKESELASRSRRPNQFGEVYFGWREGDRVKQLDARGADLASRTGHKGNEVYHQAMDKAETMSDSQLIAQYNALSKQITDASFEAGTAEGAELASALKAIQHELHARDLGYSHDRDVPYQGEADYRSAMQDDAVRNTAAKLEKMDNQTRLIVAGKAYARMLDGGDAEDENIMMAMAALYARDRKMDISAAYNAVIDETGVMQSQMQSDLDMIYQQESEKQQAMGDSAAAVGANPLPGADPLQDYAAATEAIIQRRSAGGGMRGMLNRMTSRALSESSAFKAYYNRMYAQHIKEGMSKVRAQQMAANDVRNVFRDREVQRTMPTTDTTFVLGSTLKDNMLAQMWDAGVALASGDYEGSRVVDEAYQVYSDTKAGAFANIQASAYPMAVDIASGMFAPANAAGEFVAKNVITRPLVAFAERAIGIGEKELMRRLASNLTYKTITGMTRTGVSLGVFGSTSALVRGARYGDVNGREIASSGWHMFKDGIWFGVGNTFMGKAVEGLTGAKALAGEAGVIAGETALFTALDVINTPNFDWSNIDKTIGRSLGVTLAGRIGKPAEWAQGLAARVSGTMKGSPITEAQTLNKETRRELEGSYPTICRLMSNASLAKDLAKGMTRGKYHYNESGEVDAVATANRLEREWNQMKEDKNIPYEVKRKVDYVLNGELSPRPAIANFRLSDEGEDGTSYGETLDINGNVITRHKFKNDKERKAFEKEVSLEAERNRLALEEQSINMSHLAIIQDRAAAVKATAMGVEKKAVDDILDKQANGEKLTKEEQEVVRDVVRLRDRAVEKNSATDQIKREVRERTGLDVDDIVKTPVLDRTPTQHKVLEEYEQRLRGEWDETQDMSDAEVVGHQKEQSQQEGRDATDEDKHRMQVEYEQARAEVERIGLDPRDIDRRDDEQLAFLLNNSDLEPEDAAAVMAYVNAKARYDGMIGKVREDMAEAVRQNEAEVDERTNKTDGKITTVTLKMGDKQMHVVGGRVVGNEDGTINTRESSGYIIVRDPQTGEKKSVSPQDIRTVGESLDAQQVKNDSNAAIREKMATEQGHIIDGDIAFEAGQEYMLQDTEGKDFPIRIEQVDGETVYYTEGGDPTVYSRSRDELQGWIRAAEARRQQQPQQGRGETPAQETRTAEREQRPAAPVAEERPAPARMPMTEDNKPDWENSTPEQAREYLRDLDEEDTTAIIESERKKASDAAEKALADGDVEGLKRARRMQRYWDEVDQLRRQAEQPAEPEPIVEPMDKSEMLSPEDAPRDIEAENDMQPVEEPMGEDAAASLNAGMSEEERESWVDTPEEVVDMLDSVAKSLGLTVRSESLPANVNGYQDGDVLVVNKDRGSNERVAFVMGHEMTHKLERESDEKGLATYDTFKDAALDMQRRIKEQAGEDYEEYIESLIQLYRDHHADEGYKKAKAAGMSDEQALAQAAIEEAKVDRAFVEREVAADMAGRMADKPELVRDLFNQIEEPTLMQRIKNWLVDFVNMIRGNEFVPVGDEEHWAYLADKYNQLYNEVVESRKRGKVILDETKTVTNMADVAAQDKTDRKLSLGTEGMVRDKLRKWAKTSEAKKGGWTPEKVDRMIEETGMLINNIDKALQGNKYYDDWRLRQPTIRMDWRDGEQRPVVTWSRGNIEYKYDMSADLLCINNEGMEDVLTSDTMTDLLLNAMHETAITAKDRGVFSSNDYGRLYEVMRDLGFTVPCPGCFDYAARLKMLPSVAQKFAEETNAIIDERNKNPKAFDDALKEQARKKGNALPTGLPASAKSREEAIRIAVAGDNITEHVNWIDFFTAEGQTGELAKNGGLFRAWQRTGAGRPKDKLMPEPWIGEMADAGVTTIIAPFEAKSGTVKKTPSFREQEVNQGTGLRRNSHSEFRITLIIDEIQMLREAYAKNLTVFKYMKELDDVRLFGKLGVKYNMSFFPGFDKNGTAAGLGPNGEYIAAEESVGAREFPYQGEDGKTHYDGMKGREEAMKYCNENVSLSSIAFSIPHLIKLLTDVPTPSDKRGWCGSVIPFHSSGAETKDLARQGLGMARANSADASHPFNVEAMTRWNEGVTNFEQVQNDRFGEGWVIVEGKKAGEWVTYGHKMEFANGTHYYNRDLGIHLFKNGYVYDSELPDGKVTAEIKKNPPHPFVVDYNDKVREINSDYGYKEAADYYIEALREIGMIPRFEFEVPEEVYLAACRDGGVDPYDPKLCWKGEGHAWNPTEAESYYSLWCDYGMTDPETGKWSPHRPVGYIDPKTGERSFKLPDNTIEIAKEGLERYSNRRDKESGMVNDAIREYTRRSIAEGRMDEVKAREILARHGIDFDGGEPDGGGGKKYSLSTEIAKKYPNWMDNQVVEDKGENKKRGQNTQIAGTVSTYKKVGDWVEKNLGKGVMVLDASSGLGLGTLELRSRGFDIDDIEPYPGKGRDQQPTYGGVDAYQRAMDDGKEYDYIISNAVLNVIPDDWRAGVLHDMATLLAPGGKMFINTRKAGEEKSIKNKIELESPQEVLVGTPDNITSYQRFFTPKELKEYVERELGDGYTVEVANEANSGTKGLAAVVVTKSKGENPDGPQEGGRVSNATSENTHDGDDIRFSLSPGEKAAGVTLFSGGGLIEAGLRGVVDPRAAVEYDKKIAGVYRDNHGNHIVTADVRDVDPMELARQVDGPVEYFHASPVCKNFSVLKNGGEKPLDIETAQSTANAIEKMKPRIVTIENVANYQRSDALRVIADKLDELGYTHDIHIVDAADYGAATHRRRLILRAVAPGNELPAFPEGNKDAFTPWYDRVEDLVEELPESNMPDWMARRLETSGIDWRNIDKPLLVMSSGAAYGGVGHAFADEAAPTIAAGRTGDRIVLPGGEVKKVTSRVLARLMGLGDNYSLPKSESLAHTILGNGVPIELTKNVIGPLVREVAEPSGRRYSISNIERPTASDVLKEYESFNKSDVFDKGISLIENDYKKEDAKALHGWIDAHSESARYWEKELKRDLKTGFYETSATIKNSRAIIERESKLAEYAKTLLEDLIKDRADYSTWKVKKGKDITIDDMDGLFKAHNTDDYNTELWDRVLSVSRQLGVDNIRFNKTPDRVMGRVLGGRVRFDDAWFNDHTVSDREKCETMLHEMIHHATVYAMHSPERLTDGQRAAVRELEGVYERISRDPSFAGEYGIKNAREMVAELSNPEFREKLKKKNLWQRIVDGIMRLFSRGDDGVEQTNAHDFIRNNLERLLDDFNKNAYDKFAEDARQYRPRFSLAPGEKASGGTYFSGGGLIESGLKDVLDSRFGVEYDEKIAGVYRNNHGENIVVADVRNVDPMEMADKVDGPVQYFHASPVCTRYSKTNAKRGEQEIDIETAKSTANAIDKMRPRIVTIENVADYKKGDALDIIVNKLQELGYNHDIHVVNAADYGAATRRSRLILRAVAPGYELPAFPEGNKKPTPWYERVEDLIPTLKETHIPRWIDERLAKAGIDWRNVSEPIIVFGGSAEHGGIQVARGNEPAPTLPASGASDDRIILPGGKVLEPSPRVLARIMGLPDNYELPEARGKVLSHRVLGNGIPVELTKGIIEPLIRDVADTPERARLDEEYIDAVKNGDIDKALRMLQEKAAITEGITPYIAPHGYGGSHADIAKRLKTNEGNAVVRAVADMQRFVPDNAVLVPMPPHEGRVTDSTDTMILADALSVITGKPVVIALEGNPRESRYAAKAEGRAGVSAEEMGFKRVADIPDGKTPIIIDNVVGSGETAKAAVNALGGGITLAYAKGTRSKATDGLKNATITYDDNGNVIPLSKRFDAENPDIRYSLAPTFYSNAAKAVEGVKQNKATAEQWKAMLTKAGGIKAGEDKWMGLSTWLDEHKGETLTKDEVAQFVAENGIEMEEVNYSEQGGVRIVGTDDGTLTVEGHPEYTITNDGNNHIDIYQLHKNGKPVGKSKSSLDEIEKVLQKKLGTTHEIYSGRLPYRTSGLNNLREIAFVVPGVEPYQEHDDIHFGPENQGRAVMWVRFGETTDTEGNRVLVIDEIQSNRHQDAREKGYKATANTKGYNVEKDEHGNYIVTNKDGEKRTFQYYEVHSENEAKLYAAQLDQGIFHADGIPAAPFEKNWHEVAMKRMLRLAAEEGFDKVAWTTGEQQADRYDIRNVVEDLYYKKNEDGTFNISVQTKDSRGHGEGRYDDYGVQAFPNQSEADLANLLGKEVAQKIVEGKGRKGYTHNGEKGWTTFKGNDLKIGGEGMKGFYDKMLPSFMNKYGKRWGVKVGEVTLDTPGGETMHSVDVNEDMKRSVMENGQPLFSLGAPYQGSKNKIAKSIVDLLPKGGRFVDLFSGGGAVTHAAMLSDKYDTFHMNDINPIGQRGFVSGMNGEWGNYDREINTPEEFEQVRGTMEGIVHSHNYYGRNVARDGGTHARAGINRMKSLGELKPYADRLSTTETDYRDVGLQPGDVVYADIPYQNTDKRGYGEPRFDKAEFVEWAQAQDVPVFVSEYTMPEGWTEIGSFTVRGARGGHREEKLWIQDKFADQYRDDIAEDGTMPTDARYSINGYEPQGGGRAARVQLRKLMETVAANPGKVEARRVALRELNGQAGALRKAMSKQKEYDRWTVDNLIGLAKEMLNSGLYKGMSPYEVQRLVNMVNQGVGRDDITRQANTVYDIMMKHQVREWENQFDRLLRIRENKIDANGVRVQGALDTHGQRMVQALKSALDLDEETLNERINDCRDRMGSDDNIVAGNAADEMEGLLIAQQHYDSIGRLKKAYDELKQARRTQLEQVYEFWREEKRDEDGNVMYRQDGYPQTVEKRRVRPEFGGVDESGNRRPVSEENKAKRKRVDATVARIEQSMRETQTDMVDAYKEVCDNLGGSVASSITRAKEWVERDKERVGEIHHAVNSDLLNVDEKLSGMDRSKEKGLANNAVIRFLNSPLGSFEKFMRYFGQRSAYGEGRLFNKFMRGHSDCTDAEWRAYKEGLDAMNEKSEELFGCSWEKLMVRMRGGAFANTKGKLGIEREFPPIEVSYWVDGKRVDDTLNQDEVAYLIACSKMTDGMMKLENMGIDESMIAQLRQQVDPNMLQLADWYQHEFLSKQRNRINEVYKRMFGADMAHIDNYIHLNINERGLVENKDINQRMAVSETPSTITGSLKERKRNVKPIDLHTSLLDLAMEEHQKMENWIAWAEYNRDLKDLLNYKKFKNKVYNMKSVELGSGEQLWDKFSKAVAVVTGDFQGGGKHSEMDRFATNAAKFVSSGCINFRVHTALKQLLSFPAFMSDARPDDILKAAANPMGSVQWAMENLPGFSKRWESRRVGDTRLMDTDSDYSFWRNRWVQKVNKYGMTANASVDCLTVAVGARAVYETAKRRYMSYGYDEITAERKALQDAYTSYNSSQQSSEGAFVSPMQVERTFLSAIGTTFRNASMGYQRRVTTGARNIVRMLKRGYKEDMIENTTKQMMEEGLSEEQARAAAERVYKRQLWHSMMDVANFAYALPFLWILGPTLSYLIAGDDKDIKEDTLKDLGRHAVFGSIEGLTFGGVMSELGNMVWNNRAQGNEWKDLWKELEYKDLTPLPLVSRMQGLFKSFKKGWWEGINDFAGLLIQSNVGVDPNTLTDMGVSILDGCNGDLDTSKEFAFALLRIMQFPQSQIDNLYIDELGLKGKDLGKYSYEELARRYARYKTNRAVLPSVMMAEDARDAAEDKVVKRFEEKVQERIASMDDEEKKRTFDSGDPDLKKMVGKQMAKDAGLDNEKFSKAPASNANERTARAHTTYQRIRDYTDMAEDLLLESEQNKAKEAGDEKRKEAISKAREKLNAIINGKDATKTKGEIKGLGQGQDEKVLKTLREERRKVLKELGLTR